MARKKKTGLDYYYKDVHEMDDFRVMNLMEKFGAVGYVVLDMTKSIVYRNGYYLETPIPCLASYIYRYVAGTCSLSSRDIAGIIQYCGELGFFDRELLGQSVITSREIQEHYSCVAARRKAEKTKYWLLPQEEEAQPSPEKTVTAAETEVFPKETGVFPKGTGVFPTETGINAAEMKINATETGINAAEMKINATEMKINAALIPQSKVNKSKVNKSKENETKVNESKVKQSKRASADEIFCEKEYDDAADAADDEYDYNDSYKPAYADAAAFAAGKYDSAGKSYTGKYDEIEKVYLEATGRYLILSDKDDIDQIRKEGADDRLIISAISTAASRKNKAKINSFRYFLPMIRESLREAGRGTYMGSAYRPPVNDGFIHEGCVDEEFFAGCVTEEDFNAAIDREFGRAPGWDSTPTDYSE